MMWRVGTFAHHHHTPHPHRGGPARRATRMAAVAACVGALVASAACSSDPAPAPATFCETVQKAATTCGTNVACDATLRDGCQGIGRVLSEASLAVARDCLESGVCGVSSCVGRPAVTARATPAQAALAEAFCSACASDVPDCVKQFYARKSTLPGGLVLPYTDAVATAVAEACTNDRGTCRSQFATCATETIARVVGAAVDGALSECVTAGVRRDDAVPGPPGSGGFTVATCTPENCTGCCRDDQCEVGKSEEACGSGAALCQRCSGLQTCRDGSCQEPCGPNNCDGCCDGDVCKSGQDATRCGQNGETCSDCATKGAGYQCSSRQCIDASCRATCGSGCCTTAGCQPGTSASACGIGAEACVNCGPGRTCNASARTCALDPASTWDFFVSSAVVPGVNKNNAAWDLFGLPDPYARLYTSQGTSTHTGQTAVLSDSLTPTFSESPLKAIRASELMTNFSFDILDSDLDFDDFIGGCSIRIVPENFDGRLYVQTCQPTATNVEVKLFFRLLKSR